MVTAKGPVNKKKTNEGAEVKPKIIKPTAKKKTTKTIDEKVKTSADTLKKKASPKTVKKTASKKSSAKAKGSQNFKQYEGKTLVVVESPAKAKTIEKFLGKDYTTPFLSSLTL